MHQLSVQSDILLIRACEYSLKSLGAPLPDHPLLLTALLALLLLSGRATQSLENLQVVHTDIPVVIEVKQSLQIATWFPTKYDGRFTAIGSGYLAVVNNCLAISRDNEVTTKILVYWC